MNSNQPSTNDEPQDELLADFIDEASQLLDRLNEDLLVLDEWASAHGSAEHGRCDDALMNNMFRSAHSIKGLSAMLGLANVNRLTHRVENIFDAARKDELQLNQQVVQVVFEAIDHLAEMVTLLRTEGHDEHDATKVVADIQELLQGAGCERKTTTQADAEQALVALLAQSQELPSASTAGISMSPSEAPALADHFAGLVDEAEIPAKYLAIFIDETELSLDSIADSLVGAQQQDRHATIENLLITSHRIKGSAASIGLHRPAKLAHLMEDILQELRETRAALTSEMTDAMLHCTDALRAYIVGLKSGEAPAERFSELADNLFQAHTQAMQAAETTPPAEPAPTAIPTVAATVVDTQQTLNNIAARHAGQHLLVVGRVKFVTGLALVGLKARLIFEKLSHQGELLECTPDKDSCDELETLDELTFALTTEASLSQIKAKAFVAGVDMVELLDCREPVKSQPVPATPPTKLATAAKRSESPVSTPIAQEEPAAQHDLHDAPPTKSRAGGETTNKPNETLRVDIERLDQLMNLAGQLVINKARFAQIGEGLKETMIGKQTPQLVTNVANMARKLMQETERLTPTGKPAADMETIRSHTRRLQANIELLQRELARVSQQRNRVNDLFEAVHQLDRVADGIQKSVMDTRMVPIGPLFGRFKRVVRDITRLNNKDVNLVIRGEKTELDKRMIDELGDPLIHMVRNAADHGIESSAARLAAGKPSQGTLTLDAFHRGNSIIIQVVDDGKGLDKDRILAKAVERKLISVAEAEKMTPQQAYQLIWEPGFSTAEKVTEISGRGMGMDIVRSKIEEISGTVEVDSIPGQGTTFTIKLPLTLAILPSLMAKIDGDVFALPVESIVEIVSVSASELKTVHGSKTAMIRGRVVSMVELSELFTWCGAAPAASQREQGDTTLVVLGQEGQELGLRVDMLLGEEDVVIKSMAENYRNVPGIAGASILGDGRVSLILDVAALISMSSRQCLAV